ncbi:alpha/beta hydrolase [Paenibacillus alkalitolerans]|uniref:alpha/beta hydrolase n=1 Tax=Paenibacillus alkalitolerans TaxID=2799335 RepID=UPI0018F71EBC|nr:alpha/beta hydrolase [Paenibacillus alkalitolerans]
MLRETFTFEDPVGSHIFVYKWSPEEDAEAPVRGVVQLAHGMVETAARYERFAEMLTKAGYVVYANDHRGHGMTAGKPDNVGVIGEDGFNWMVNNMRQLNGIIRDAYPDVPVFLFAHSMGSFLAQRYCCLYGETIAGAVFSGTSGKVGPLIHLAVYLAKREMRRRGKHSRSKLLNALVFGQYNNAFRPARTDFDWLSADPDEVDKYIADPYCGAVVTAEFYYELFRWQRDNYKPELLRNIPKRLPVHLMSGDRDPLGKNGKGVLELFRTFVNIGIKDVTCKLYPQGRHEMLNEVNREEVMQDVVNWLDARCGTN